MDGAAPSLAHRGRFYPLNQGDRDHFGATVRSLMERFESYSAEDHISGDSGSDDEVFEVLDTAGVWNLISDWMDGSVNYEILMRNIDFQRDKYPNIQYWEDVLSALAFEQDLDKREALFKSVSFEDHCRQLAGYQPLPPQIIPAPQPSLSPRLSSPSRPSLTLRQFLVRISPRMYCIHVPLSLHY